MSTKRVHRILAAGAAFAIGGLAVGCSSNSPKSTAAASTTIASTTIASATSAATSSTSGAPAVAAADTAAQTSSAPPVKPGSGKGSKFCNQLQQLAAYENGVGDSATDTPEQLKKTIQLYDGVKSSLEKSAPAEIKPDLTTLFGYLDQFYGALAKANYDVSKVDPTVFATLTADGDQLEAAGDHVTDYVKTACGIDLDSAGPSS